MSFSDSVSHASEYARGSSRLTGRRAMSARGDVGLPVAQSGEGIGKGRHPQPELPLRVAGPKGLEVPAQLPDVGGEQVHPLVHQTQIAPRLLTQRRQPDVAAVPSEQLRADGALLLRPSPKVGGSVGGADGRGYSSPGC